MMSAGDTQPEALFGAPLEQCFFKRHPLEVARDLIGRVIASDAPGARTAGLIVETEAYLGFDDPGSHASTRGVTARNAVMYGPPGSVYVYFTYGNHHMLNLVCEPEGVAGAVLIRALEPIHGIDVMAKRRGGRQLHELCNGPGKLAQALGVDLTDNGSMLGVGRLQVYAGLRPRRPKLRVSGRVGLREGHELPFRVYEADSRFVSRGRTGPSRPRVRRTDRAEGGNR